MMRSIRTLRGGAARVMQTTLLGMACVAFSGCPASKAVRKDLAAPAEPTPFHHYLRRSSAPPTPSPLKSVVAPPAIPPIAMLPDLPEVDSPPSAVTAALLPPLPSEPAASNPAEPILRMKLEELPEPTRNFEGITAEEVRESWLADRRAEAFLKERREGTWFAAAVETGLDRPAGISLRFKHADDLEAFVREEGAIIETWTRTPEAASPDLIPAGRRLTASEVTALHRQEREPPTVSVLAFKDRESQRIKRTRLEFGLQGANVALTQQEAYHRHRLLQVRGRSILHARDAKGRMSAIAQWRRLQASLRAGEFAVAHQPKPPAGDDDFLVAIEYEVESSSNFTHAVRFYRRHEISKQITGGRQYLELRPLDADRSFQAVGIPAGPVAGALSATGDTPSVAPTIHPLPGLDIVDMRVFDQADKDARSWNMLDFGEPEITRQRGLASFGLLQGHLENKKKVLALRKSKLDLFAEPVILGLNLGGAVSGVSAPLGDGARLAYNLLIAPAFLERLPAIGEYPEWLHLLASGSDPDDKLGKFFGTQGVTQLRNDLAGLDSAGLDDMLRTISHNDIRAMAKLSRGRSMDERYRLLADIATGTAAVTQSTDSGASQSIFDNGVIALNGDVSIKNAMALALGREDITPKSDYSLEDLLDNRGPSSAWWQFLDLSVDLRAVVNSMSLFRRDSEADRLMNRPFPHSPLLSDLAAYEIRGFGFPAFIFYKRKLIMEDAEAFASNYAYGVVGTRIVERFPDQASFVDEIKAGRIVPLGFVQVRTPDYTVHSSDLPVFSHRIAGGQHDGKLALVMFGLQAFHEHFQFVQREHSRFRSFESALVAGGVIEAPLSSSMQNQPPTGRLEPAVFVGEKAIGDRYHRLLHAMLEYHRFRRLHDWGVVLEPSEKAELRRLSAELKAKGVFVEGPVSPLVSHDARNSRFVYLRRTGMGSEKIQVILIPSLRDVSRGILKKQAESLAESRQKQLAE